MKQYQPNTPFDIPFKVLTLTKTFINGINTQNYKESEDTYFCGIKSYGGTEKVINDVYVIEDTIVVDTYNNVPLKSKDRIKLLDDNSVYEVMNTPEVINRRSPYMRFKGVRVHG